MLLQLNVVGLNLPGPIFDQDYSHGAGFVSVGDLIVYGGVGNAVEIVHAPIGHGWCARHGAVL